MAARRCRKQSIRRWTISITILGRPTARLFAPLRMRAAATCSSTRSISPICAIRRCATRCGRAGGFEPLRFVPKGKQVVLGLVTSKSGTLESREELKRRIDAAAKFVDIDQLCLSPQCGFASTEDGNVLAEEEQWAKLRMIVEVAQEVWG